MLFLRVGGLAAASLVGTTAALGGSSSAYTAGSGVTEHQTFGRMEYYRLSTPSIGWEPGVNVLLPFGALKHTAKYYGHFASVSSRSGPAELRGETGSPVTTWANLSSATVELGGGMVYGEPWDEARVSADNPMENLESYRGKRIFLVAGTDVSDINEGRVLPTQQTFGAALDAAGIPHERYEDDGAHFVRRERLQQDIDGVVAHLAKAG